MVEVAKMPSMDKWQKADAARAGSKSTRNEARIAQIRARMFGGKKDEAKSAPKPTQSPKKKPSPAQGAAAASGGGSQTKANKGRGNGAAEVARRKADKNGQGGRGNGAAEVARRRADAKPKTRDARTSQTESRIKAGGRGYSSRSAKSGATQRDISQKTKARTRSMGKPKDASKAGTKTYKSGGGNYKVKPNTGNGGKGAAMVKNAKKGQKKVTQANLVVRKKGAGRYNFSGK